jgi:hypothetical protein
MSTSLAAGTCGRNGQPGGGTNRAHWARAHAFSVDQLTDLTQRPQASR